MVALAQASHYFTGATNIVYNAKRLFLHKAVYRLKYSTIMSVSSFLFQILFLLILTLGSVARKQKKTKNDETFLTSESVPQCKLSDPVLSSEDAEHENRTYYNPDDPGKCFHFQ